MSRAPATKPELPILEFATDAQWRGWLAERHALSPGVWLKFAKRDAAASTVNHAQALDTAICFGWIDGQTRRLNDGFWLQRFTPRGPPEQVVPGQPGQGRAADRRSADARGRARPGAGRPRGRALGRGV